MCKAWSAQERCGAWRSSAAIAMQVPSLNCAAGRPAQSCVLHDAHQIMPGQRIRGLHSSRPEPVALSAPQVARPPTWLQS